MTRLRFTRAQRMLASREFKAVLEGAEARHYQGPFLLVARRNQLPDGRLGLIIAKRHVKRAHERNRLKRLIRESFRHHTDDIPGLDVVVMARGGADQLTNEDIFAQLDASWRRLARKLAKRVSPPTPDAAPHAKAPASTHPTVSAAD